MQDKIASVNKAADGVLEKYEVADQINQNIERIWKEKIGDMDLAMAEAHKLLPVGHPQRK